MPFPLDSDTEAAIVAGRIKTADLVDFYLRDGADDPLTLRCWNRLDDAVYPGTTDLDGSTDNQTYQSMYGRIRVAKAIRMAASLSSEPIVITLDGSRSDDDDDWVGQFVDSTWHQARVRVRGVMINMATAALHSQPHWEWRGLIDHRNLTTQAGQPQKWEVKCQGGLFRVRGRRHTTRSQEDQQRRSAGDNFYNATALMVGVPLNWAKAPANIPGLKTNGAGGPNGFNPSPGGSSGGNRYNSVAD
jgi:hypothetical protein